MFSPEMLKAAQGMMANMSPEDRSRRRPKRVPFGDQIGSPMCFDLCQDMQRMTQMAANMDPSVMALRLTDPNRQLCCES